MAQIINTDEAGLGPPRLLYFFERITMKRTPTQTFNLHQVVSCQTVRGIEFVVIYDAQRRSSDYAYLVVNDQGEMFVAWPNRVKYRNEHTLLIQMSKLPITENPNIDIQHKCFKQTGYIVY